ncbi:MAG: DUF4430 domain-containing protein [Clostridium sp.]
MKKICRLLLCYLMIFTFMVGCAPKIESVEKHDGVEASENIETSAEDTDTSGEESGTTNDSNKDKDNTEQNNSEEGSGSASTYNQNSGTSNGDGGSANTESSGNSNSAQTPATPKKSYVTMSITCHTILNNLDKVTEGKKGIVPANGVIYSEKTIEIKEGETVFDVLLRETRGNRIHMDFIDTPIYQSNYIKGIANLYEFDAGDLSGWMYSVNGTFPGYGCSKYTLKDGDKIEWKYTCDLGRDLGAGM